MKWKLIGIVLTLIGGLATLASNYVDDKQMEDTIREEVEKQLTERTKAEEL